MTPAPTRQPRADMDELTVADVMTKRVLGVVPGTQVTAALAMMTSAGVHHLPVIENNHCTGMLFENDVLWRLCAAASLTTGPIAAGQVQRTPAHRVTPEDSLAVAAGRMLAARTDALLVTERDRIVGILTAMDLVKAWETRTTRDL